MNNACFKKNSCVNKNTILFIKQAISKLREEYDPEKNLATKKNYLPKQKILQQKKMFTENYVLIKDIV